MGFVFYKIKINLLRHLSYRLYSALYTFNKLWDKNYKPHKKDKKQDIEYAIIIRKIISGMRKDVAEPEDSD